MTKNETSTEKMRAEILTDAQRECEEIIIRARQDAEVIVTNANIEAGRLRQEQLDQARVEASRRSGLILDTVPVETSRLRAARVETLLESVHEEARQQLLAHEGFEYRETIIALASYAINRMAGAEFVVKLLEAEQTILGDGLAEEITHRVERPANITILYVEDITGGGVVIEDAEARQVWDNRLLKRLERLWPELRQQIAVEASFVPKTAPGEGGP